MSAPGMLAAPAQVITTVLSANCRKPHHRMDPSSEGQTGTTCLLSGLSQASDAANTMHNINRQHTAWEQQLVPAQSMSCPTRFSILAVNVNCQHA